ncbi:MAG: hypothetical protein RBR78_10775 [Flavobacteriaceae bacterium]|jgi:hypothetical protein|nr:hypothetical protein [Flavobacteriaceae bacterium]
MKNIIKITALFVIFTFTNKMNAQMDTLTYVKTFEINKANYIGQPLSVLLNDMTLIQPKTIWFVPITNKKTMVKESLFKFCEVRHSYKNAITLRITWQDYIPFSQVDYYQNLNDFFFTNDERLFYGNKIIEDIMVYR